MVATQNELPSGRLTSGVLCGVAGRITLSLPFAKQCGQIVKFFSVSQPHDTPTNGSRNPRVANAQSRLYI